MQGFARCCEDPVMHERITKEVKQWVWSTAHGVRSTAGCTDKHYPAPSLGEYQLFFYGFSSHFIRQVFSECVFGWTYSPHTRYCYRRFDDKLLVFEAGQKCEEFSGHLASIHDWYTNNFLVSLTSHLPASEANSWIGLYWDWRTNFWNWEDGSPKQGSFSHPSLDNANPDSSRRYVEFNR